MSENDLVQYIFVLHKVVFSAFVLKCSSGEIGKLLFAGMAGGKCVTTACNCRNNK